MADLILFQPSIGGDWSCINTPHIPLGLLSASRFVNKEYSIKLIDERLNKNWRGALKKELNKNPICFATTSMTGPQINHALSASAFIKKESNIPVIWGGIHPTILPEQTLKNKNIDIVVRGEGELTFYELVKCLDHKNDLKNILGISFKKQGKIYTNNKRPFLDLNKLPKIPYGIINLDDYLTTKDDKLAINIFSSRGCPNKCSYCYNTVNNNCWRSMSPSNFIKELEDLLNQSNKIEHINIQDDNFFVNIKRAKEIIQKLCDYNLSWECQGLTSLALSQIDSEFMELLVKSGCISMQIGTESGSKKILNSLNKKNNLNHIYQFNKRISDYPIRLEHNFMCGFPMETTKDLKESVNLALKLIKDNPNSIIKFFSIYVPYLGTESFKQSIQAGFLPPTYLEDWADHDWRKVKTNWLDEKTKKLLEGLYFTSLFIDSKPRIYIKSKVIKKLASLYRPIALFRMKNLFFRCMPEKQIKDFYESLTRKT